MANIHLRSCTLHPAVRNGKKADTVWVEAGAEAHSLGGTKPQGAGRAKDSIPMPIRYKTGTKTEVIRTMANYAIRDQEALIDAHTPSFGEPCAEFQQVIQQCRDAIADFRRLVSSLPPGQ
ncbi:MAG: hypothetical protein O9327_02430 [Polaromonas sp.]|nr:hypothetical protein [Polaromonas sp.]